MLNTTSLQVLQLGEALPLTLDYAVKVTGLLTLFVLIRQLRIQQRSHLVTQRAHMVDVYRNVFEIMDKPTIREARRFLYKYKDADRERVRADLDRDEPMKAKVEELVRAFDQLGLLVREGQVPVDVVARFYASPAMRCWFILIPYVLAEREYRGQPGHLWEWENLVRRIIEPGLVQGGVWNGVAVHDALGGWAEKIERDAKGDLYKRFSDDVYSPGARLWEIERQT
jgi:hypothetical protein